jgi:hypothetical protein
VIVRSTFLAVALVTSSMVPLSSTMLPPQYLPIYGGNGGTSFTRSCGSGKVLTGLRWRDGMVVDAIGLLCRSVLADGKLGSESTAGTFAGGGGGTSGSYSCGAGTVMTKWRIRHGTYVNEVLFWCQAWNSSSRAFEGPKISPTASAGSYSSSGNFNYEECEAPSQPANGIRGRAASVVDAIGFICNEP